MGNELKEIREARGLTQKAVEKAFGLSNGMVSKWESKCCKPSIKIIPKLAEMYGITVEELIKLIGK